MLELIGEQRKVLGLPSNVPIQIKGIAGSGKTTIAICRALHLLNTKTDLFLENNAVIFSYTGPIVNHIKNIINKSDLKKNIEIKTFHGWALKFIKDNNLLKGREIIKNSEVSSFIGESKKKRYSNNYKVRSNKFYENEITWIKDNGIDNQNDYLNVIRSGRKIRVSKEERKFIWNVYENYNNLLIQNNKIEFADFGLIINRYLSKKSVSHYPYKHIIIDEAQDFTKVMLAVISKLINPESNSVTIIADAAQSIYQSGFSWKQVGLNITGGRTIELKSNYRNTYEIFDLANSLIKFDKNCDEFTLPEKFPIRNGEKPKLINCKDSNHQLQIIQNLVKSYFNKGSIVIANAIWGKTLEEIKNTLEDSGFVSKKVKNIKNLNLKSNIYLSSLHSLKGLEYDTVIISDFNEGFFPFKSRYMTNDVYNEDFFNESRRVLYTAITRAKKNLFFISNGSEQNFFLEELDKDKLIIENL